MFSSVFFHWPLNLTSWLTGPTESKQMGGAPSQIPVEQGEPTTPIQKTTQRILAGGNYGLQVDGCQSRGQQFAASAPGELDPTKGGYRGFDLDVTGNNGHGVRNISVEGNTIRFEAFADGKGTQQGMLGCVGAEGANVNVNVYAYIKE